MEIVKTKGAQDKYLFKDEKIILGELKNLKRLPKTKNIKRVFYKTCPTFGRRLIPFPYRNLGDNSFLPKKFAGDVLVDSEKTAESILVKYVLENGRVIPVLSLSGKYLSLSGKYLSLSGKYLSLSGKYLSLI